MEFLKSLFGDGESLTYGQLAAKIAEQKMNVVNLADGGYVSQAKFDDRTRELSQQVTTLQGQITQRDTDLTNLRTNLTAAQADANKLLGLQQSMADLQAQYDADKVHFTEQIAAQKRSFAIRERANALNFSSKAAKNEFIREAEGLDLKLDGQTLLGYEDFVAKYKADNADSFVPDEPPTPPQNPTQPQIVLPNGGTPSGGNDGGFGFHFMGVRPHDKG